MSLTDQELLDLNRRGLIPGPQESEEEFLQRLAKIETVKAEGVSLSSSDWEEAYAVLEPHFGIRPDWVRAYYSPKGLPFWQAAATWIEESIPSIQLKPPFQKGSYYKLYSRKEVLAHEAVHAARTAFNEPRFEEIFAYKTSARAFSRWIGPLFKRSWESYLLIALVPLLATPLFSLPLLAIAFGSLRLAHAYWHVHLCTKKLSTFVKNPRVILLCLTDREILLFGRMSQEAIQTYVSKGDSLRLRMLSLLISDQP